MSAHAIVGSWRVNVHVPGLDQPVINLATFTRDQTVIVALATPSPAAPGQDHRFEFFSTALGSWRDEADGTVAMTFISLGADENAKPAGTHTISAHVTISGDQQSWSGPFRIDVASAAGAALGSVEGTVAATRIIVGPFSTT